MGHGGRRFLIAAALALLLHGALAAFVLSLPARQPPPKPEKVAEVTPVHAVNEVVELPKPKPPPPKPKPAPEPKPPPKKAPKPTKVARVRPRLGRPTPIAHPKGAPPPKPKPATKPPPPAPLVLSHLSLSGGVQVQKGKEDILGNPNIKATPENTKPAPRGVENGSPEGTGTAGGPPRRVPPRIVHRVSGHYPPDAPRLGREVDVTLSLLIDARGRVSRIKLVQGAGGSFDREARRVARQLRFKPGTVGGKPTAMWVPWVVAFQPTSE